MTSESFNPSPGPRGVEYAGIIDLLAHDAGRDEVTLAMVEPRPWDGSELRLFQLQEKINAYLSFALDGEMTEEYPTLRDKPLRIQLDCTTAPDPVTLRFLGVVRDQIAFQGIKLEVRVGAGACGPQCGCAPSGDEGSTF